MQSFDFSGGIGTASRIVRIAGIDCVLGALVLSNFGNLENLRVDGTPVGAILDPRFDAVPRRGPAGRRWAESVREPWPGSSPHRSVRSVLAS